MKHVVIYNIDELDAALKLLLSETEDHVVEDNINGEAIRQLRRADHAVVRSFYSRIFVSEIPESEISTNSTRLYPIPYSNGTFTI